MGRRGRRTWWKREDGRVVFKWAWCVGGGRQLSYVAWDAGNPDHQRRDMCALLQDEEQDVVRGKATRQRARADRR